MAKDFEINPRQVRSTPERLSGGNALGQFAQALGTAASQFGQIGVEASVEQAAIQGAQERLEGKKRKLAPGVTKATRSFNDAYAGMDKNIIFAETMNQIDLAKQEATAPGRFKPGVSLNEFVNKSNSMIAQAVNNALPENKAALAFELKKNQANDQLQIKGFENDFVYKQGQKTDEATRESLLRQATNAAQDGNSEIANESFNNLVSQIQSSVQLGFYTQAEAENYLQEVRSEIVKATYRGEGQRAALAVPGYAEQRLAELASEIDALGLPADIKDIALKSFQEGLTSRQSAMTSQQAINEAQVKFDIQSGLITEASQIDAVSQGLTKLQQLSLQTALQKKQNKENDSLTAINNFRLNAFEDTGQQTSATKETKNAALAQDLITKQQDLAEKTGNPNAAITPMDIAQSVASYNTNIPAWDNAQSAAILSGDYNRAKDYLQAYQYQKNHALDNKVSSSVGLKGDALDVADMYVQRAPYVDNAAKTYYELIDAVKNKDDEVRKSRISYFDHKIKDAQKRAQFKENFGTNVEGNLDIYNQWLNASRDSFGRWGQNYTDQVFASTADEMKNRIRTSRYNTKGILQANPVEAISDQFNYGQLGNNFVYGAIYELVQANKALPPEIRKGQEIEWGLKQPFPANVSEEEMFALNIPWRLSVPEGQEPNIYTHSFYQNESTPSVFVNGKRADVVLVTGGFSVQQDQPVANVFLRLENGDVVPWQDPYNPSTGLAQIRFPPAKQVIPSVMANLSETSEQAEAQRIAESIVNPKPLQTPTQKIKEMNDFLLNLIPPVSTYRIAKYLSPSEQKKRADKEIKLAEETKKVKEQLKSKREGIKQELERGL